MDAQASMQTPPTTLSPRARAILEEARWDLPPTALLPRTGADGRELGEAVRDALALLDRLSTPDAREQRLAAMRTTHPRAFAPWTDDEDARLRSLAETGAPLAEAVRQLGRQPGAIRARAEKLLGAATPYGPSRYAKRGDS